MVDRRMMGRGALVCVLLAAGCGDVSGNSNPDAAKPIDAPAPAKRCTPDAPFQPRVPLGSLNTADSDEGGWLSPDELTIYFDSTRSGTLGLYDIFMATRVSKDADFGNVTPVMGVNDAGHQRNPSITADGLTMFALIGTAPNYEVAMATRTSTSSSFGALTAIAGINSTANDEPNSILPDGRVLYFSSNRSGKYKIYRVTHNGGTWGTPLEVSGVNLNGNDNDSNGLISADELTLFFSSDRTGGVGSLDVWMATRRSTADGFSDPVNVQVLNTAGLDVVSWISTDGCVIYGASGPCCTYDLSMAMRGM